jgi:L-asparaginase/Glu-tRNA(Gln) amidotransferase subunit D
MDIPLLRAPFRLRMANGKSLNIMVFGGTLACEDVSEDPNVQDLHPKKGKVQQVYDQEVDDRVKELYKNVTVEDIEPFLDSSNYKCESLEEIANAVRANLKARVGNIIAVVGTDQGSFAAHAIADAVNPERLQGRSITVVSSMEASARRRGKSVMWSQAGADLTNAVYLSARDELKGKIANYCGGLLAAPRGLKELHNDGTIQPFGSRFAPITMGSDPPAYKWTEFNVRDVVGATSSPRNVLCPTGAGQRYKLLPGVEQFSLNAISNYANTYAMAKGGVSEGTLNGLVLSAPGKGDFRNVSTDLEDLVKAADLCVENGIPVVSVSDPFSNNGNGTQKSTISSVSSKYGSTASGEHFEEILHVTPLSANEAQMVISESLYHGRKKLSLQGPDLVEYVYEELRHYRNLVQQKLSHDRYMDWKRERRNK